MGPAPTLEHDQAPLTPAARGGFLLATCQGGAEGALRDRQQSILPALAPAAWRRGVVTFRLGGFDPADDFWPDLIFARTVIRSCGQVSAGDEKALVTAALALVGHAAWDTVHVWHRDPRQAADGHAESLRRALLSAIGRPADLASAARPGALVLDCLVDSPERCWVGWHRVGAPPSRHPGGLHPAVAPPETPSRAWLKLDEALTTFAVPLEPGQRAVELGASPGGACQRLLEAGLTVVGIDPAPVAAPVASHPRFEQWRMRARDVKLRNFRGFDWIVTDMNIDPHSALDALERIVTAAGVRPRGIIATLKLPDWSRAAEVPAWLERFRGWGFDPQARQLSTSGREICVVASKSSPPRPAGPVRPRATRRPDP